LGFIAGSSKQEYKKSSFYFGRISGKMNGNIIKHKEKQVNSRLEGGDKVNAECIFCKIAAQEIPSKIVYQDSDLIAIEDINPMAPIHILLIPRKHIPSLNEAGLDDAVLLGHVQLAAAAIAREKGIAADGYRLINNCGEWGGQTVMHVHYHLLGGRNLKWPPG
jgi:histidine triad (HIT) family protein